MKIRFWGTSCSIPTPGTEIVHCGGNTPCMEVRLQNKDLLIFDSRTGIKGLGDEFSPGEKR